MDDKKETTSIKDYFLKNTPFIFGVGVALINVYIASIISPLKSDIGSLAERIEKVEREGSVSCQLIGSKVTNVEDDIREIKDSIKSIDSKIERLR
jgi:hypothetical protein